MSDDLSIYVYVLMLPYDSPPGYFKSDPFSLWLSPGNQRIFADKVFFCHLYGKSKPGLQRGYLVIHLMSIKRHRRLHAKRISGAKAAGNQALFLTRLKQDIPQFFGKAGIQI